MSIKEPSLELRIAHNKAQLVEALKTAGIASAIVEYSGEGDDGGHYDFAYTPDLKIDTPITIKVLTGEFVDGKWKHCEVEKSMPMDDALGNFLDELLTQHGHDGYENGDGGGGTLTINVQENSYLLEHYDNIVQQESSSHEG